MSLNWTVTSRQCASPTPPSHTPPLPIPLCRDNNVKLQSASIRIIHSPHSPDLASMDFHVFPQVKRQLRGYRHADREELVSNVQQVVRLFDELWYRSAFNC